MIDITTPILTFGSTRLTEYNDMSIQHDIEVTRFHGYRVLFFEFTYIVGGVTILLTFLDISIHHQCKYHLITNRTTVQLSEDMQIFRVIVFHKGILHVAV